MNLQSTLSTIVAYLLDFFNNEECLEIIFLKIRVTTQVRLLSTVLH